MALHTCAGLDLIRSDIEEIHRDLVDGLRLHLSLWLIVIAVYFFSLFSSETTPETLPSVVADGVIGDFVGVFHVELLHHCRHFLYLGSFTFSLTSSWREIMCFDKNSHVLNFLSQKKHFQMSRVAPGANFSVSRMNFSTY
jgi:hypothetical protein